MCERLTDRARTALIFAQEDAKALGHNYVGTEHILLGLIHEGEGVAAMVLLRSGLNLDQVRETVAELVGPMMTVTGHIPYTPRAKRVLEGSLRESLRMEQSYIGTEHLLLSLVFRSQRADETIGVATQVFEKFGVTPEQIDIAVFRTLGLNRPTDDDDRPHLRRP